MSMFDDQAEWDEMLAGIPLDSTTGEAARALAAMLADAVQSQRGWAAGRLDDAVLVGLGKAWKSFVQRQRPRVQTKNGFVKQVGGVRRVGEAGNVSYLQLPYEHMTFDEIRNHRALEIANLSALAENTKALARLLDLQDRCPAAKTPAEACRKLGLDPAEVMAGAA